MKKTILRVLLAAVSAASVALIAQRPAEAPNCVAAGNKMDCQDCCVAIKQACTKKTLGSAVCETFDFNVCMSSCKSLENETGPGEAHTNPQGNPF